MSYTALLIQSCTTERFTTGPADDYGMPTKIWSNHLVDEACRLISGAGREVQVGARVVIAEYRLFLGDCDITEQDRVTVDDVLYSARSHHLECLVRTVR